MLATLSAAAKVKVHILADEKLCWSSEENSKKNGGKLIADVGCEPILHIGNFQATKRSREKLVEQNSSYRPKKGSSEGILLNTTTFIK
ncbi:quinolinate synthase [Salvia divinorum]|uniref:Quinolinate synthase n=1 Tax=Salvia divinorum TaxID=28513 RepID=A0ABD1IJ25_SALDI